MLRINKFLKVLLILLGLILVISFLTNLIDFGSGGPIVPPSKPVDITEILLEQGNIYF